MKNPPANFHTVFSDLKSLLRPSRVLALLALVMAGSQAASAVTVTTNFNSAGTFFWTPPAGVTMAQIECWGAGGGGGGCAGGTFAVPTNSSGGGGSGGAYARVANYSVSALSTYTIQVGSPGAAGAAGGASGSSPGGAGGTGNDSWFFDTANVAYAVGGTGGGGGGFTAPGGAGGICPSAGNIGDVTFLGGTGAAGLMIVTNFGTPYGGGGGSSAGNSSNGNVGGTNGLIAAAVAGGGPGGQSKLGGNSGIAPTSGPGGGGGGGISAGPTARAGAVGFAGKVSITYTLPGYEWIGDGVNNRWSTSVSDICWDTNAAGIVNTYFIDGIDVAFSVEASNNPTINITGQVQPSSTTVNSASDYTFTGSGYISGTNFLTKLGAGVLTIATANDYSGGTTNTSGRIRLGNDNALGTGPVILGAALSSVGSASHTVTNAVLIAAATIIGDLTDNGRLTFASPVDLGNVSRTVTFNSDATFAGGMINNGMTKAGLGTLTVNGIVNLTAGMDIQTATVIFDAAMVTNSLRILPDAGTGAGSANGMAHMVVTNGASITLTGPTQNLKCGNTATTGSNILDFAGSFNVPNADANSGNVLLYGGGSAYSEITFLPGGDFTARAVTNAVKIGKTVFKFNGGMLRALTDNAYFFEGISNAWVMAGGANIDDRGFQITINQSLLDAGGGLTKIGSGRLTLNTNNAYSGSTVVSNGTLALTFPGSVANSTNIYLAAGTSTLDVSATSPWTLGANQTLGGLGGVNGSVVANGKLASSSPIGTLTFANDLTLAGTTVLRVNKDSGLNNDVIAVQGQLSYGGTLQIVLTGSTPLAVNDTFHVFSFGAAPLGSFASISLPVGYGWDTSQLAVDGTIKVAPAGPTGSNTLTNNFTGGGSTLSFSWGAGWKLQMQTNSLSKGLGTNWIYLTDGTATSTNVPVSKASPAVFYRLTYP